MNICIKKYKVFIISLCLVSMFSFNFCQLRANAVAGADDAVVIGGVTVTSGMVAYAVGALVVAGGATIYANTDSTDIKYIADGMIQTGEATKAFGVQTLATGQKVLTWTKDGLDWVGNKISDMVSTGSITIPLPNSVSVSFDSSLSSGRKQVNEYIGTVSGVSIGTVLHVGGKTYGINKGSSYSVKIYKYYQPVSYGTETISVNIIPTGVNSGSGITSSIGTLTYPVFPRTIDFSVWTDNTNVFNSNPVSDGSICIPLGNAAKTYNPTTASDVIGSSSTANDGSISYQPKVGFPLTDSGDTTADGAPVYAPSADIPYGKTWNDVPTVSIPTDSNPAIPGDTTGNPAIPGDTTGTIDTGKGILNIPILGDILKVLQKILDFLGTMIGSLVTALINALEQLLTKLFVPTADMFNDFYSDIESNVKSKFPYSVSILDSLKVNADEFKDIHVTLWGHDCVIVSAQFVNDNISWIRVVTSCFWIFSLFVYVWRKINSVLNGGDVNSTTVYAPGGGGSGPPSVI